MSETKVLTHRGNPTHEAILRGTLTITIADANTTGNGTITFDPTWEEAPMVLLGVPEFAQTAGGSATYVRSMKKVSTGAVSVLVTAELDTAPVLYHTVTLTVPYILVGKKPQG
jgi:hypothetical protein